MAGALILATSCSTDDDDSDAAPTDDRTTDTDTSESTTTTQPPATGETQQDAFDDVRDVVIEATGLVDTLFQNPELVNNPNNDDIDRLRELYTEDSATPDGVLAQLEQLADDGQSVQPANDVFRDLGVYQMAAADENTVRFRVCATEDQETVDESGTVVDVLAQVTQGDGEARRVAGRWRLHGIEPRDDLTLEFGPGTADPGFCDQAYGDEGTG